MASLGLDDDMTAAMLDESAIDEILAGLPNPGAQRFLHACTHTTFSPNVAGWDDTRWIDTATYRGRWIGVQRLLRDHAIDPSKPAAAKLPADADKLVAQALAFWRNPRLSDGTSYALHHFARAALKDAHGTDWKLKQYPALIENALRQLIAVSPDAQTS